MAEIGSKNACPLADTDNQQKNRERKCMFLNDLPDECLIPILKKIPLKNMDDVTEVCQRWDKVIQENIGLEIWITDIGFRIGYRFFDGLSELNKFSIEVLKSRVITEILSPLKNPDALLELELASQTTIETFKTLTDKTINLKELHFGYSSLTLEDIGSVSLDLPNLKLLNIADRAFECNEIDGPENLTKNVLKLLQKTYPALVTLNLSTVATRRISERYGIQLLMFIQTHFNTLKNLNVAISTAIQRNPVDDYGSLDHVAIIQDDALDMLNCNQLQKVRLQKLDLDFGSKFFVGMNEWRQILSNQDALITFKLNLTNPLPTNVCLPAIPLSAAFLVSIQLGLEIYRPDMPKTPLDCSLFEACENLKMLLLVGNPMFEERPKSKEIFNTQNLPKSLHVLRVQNMFMETIETENVFFQLPEIKKIAFENIGWTDEYGMTLPLLNKVLNTQQLLEITIKGINGDECELHHYNKLTKLGLTLPLSKALFHVTFFAHYKEYVQAA